MIKSKYLNTFIFAFAFLFMFLCAPMTQATAHASGRCADLFSEVSHESKAQVKNEQVQGKSKQPQEKSEHTRAKNEQVEQVQVKNEQVQAKSKQPQEKNEHTRAKGEQVQVKSEQQVQSTQRTRSEQTDVDGTKGLIAYLGLLLERQIIGDKELLRLIEGLERDEIPNPIHEEDTWVSSTALIHREAIQNYIHKTQINPKELLEWSKKSLKEKERVRVKREETREETKNPYQKIELHPVRAGRFRMGEKAKDKVEVNLTHPIEVMSTPVTQQQWVEIMEKNPSHFSKGGHSIVVSLNGKSIQMQPDNPVENITWWSALVFANKLSEKYGFKPVYDLSEITWKQGTRAENGTLQVESESESKKIKINANGGVYDPYIKDIYYQSEGFRLPTEAEQEYMLRAAGTANGIYYFGDNKAELKDHAWYKENAHSQTHPVAELKPLIIDGKELYDLLGNVWEWGGIGMRVVIQGLTL